MPLSKRKKNDRSPYDLPRTPLGVPALRQKPPCFNVYALLLVKIVHSKNAQCRAKQ